MADTAERLARQRALGAKRSRELRRRNRVDGDGERVLPVPVPELGLVELMERRLKIEAGGWATPAQMVEFVRDLVLTEIAKP
jgi:hypothetical protein